MQKKCNQKNLTIPSKQLQIWRQKNGGHSTDQKSSFSSTHLSLDCCPWQRGAIKTDWASRTTLKQIQALKQVGIFWCMTRTHIKLLLQISSKILGPYNLKQT